MKESTFKDALKFWTKLGFISFGGPAGQIAIMHQEVVERRKWIGENQFLRALNFCMLLPGPEAQQLATYIGWRLHGTWGGIAAGSLFVIPSIFVMLLLSYLAVAHIDIPAVAAAFYGIQPVVVAVVIEAVLRIGKKALKHGVLYAFAAIAFVAIFFLKIPFPYIVAAAALGGLLMQRQLPQVFCRGTFDTQTRECRIEAEPATGQNITRPSFYHVLRVFLICLVLWAGGGRGHMDLAGVQRHVDSDRSVFYKGRLCHLWRCLRRTELYHRGRGIQRLAVNAADVDRTRSGRIHPRPIDHGHPVCGFFGGLESPRWASSINRGNHRCPDHHLCDVSALLFLYLRRCAIHRSHGGQPAPSSGTHRRHRSGCGRGTQPGGLVRV